MYTRPVSNPFGIGGLSKSSRFELLALFASPRVEASSGEQYSKLCGPKGFRLRGAVRAMIVDRGAVLVGAVKPPPQGVSMCCDSLARTRPRLPPDKE